MSTGKRLTRIAIRRKLDQAANLCDNIQQHLADAAAPFIEQGRSEQEAFIALGTVLEMFKNEVESLRNKI